MVDEASLLVDYSFKDGWAKVFVCVEDNIILVVKEFTKQASGYRGDVVFPPLSSQVVPKCCCE